MALEHSVLNEQSIKAIIYEKYGIELTTVLKIEMGTANCYKLSNPKKSYFLKEFQSWFTDEDLQRETALSDFLIQHGYPTASIIPSVSGAKYVEYQKRYILVQEFIEGETYHNHDIPERLLIQAAELLGRLHSLLVQYSLPSDMDENWCKRFNPNKSAEAYDELLMILEQQKGTEHDKQIKEDLLYKKQMLYRINEYGQLYDKLTYNSTHGDYTCFQYICENESIKAIIDFSSARRLPVVWELMRSYTQSSLDCKSGTDIDVENLKEYVRHYLKYFKLTKEDLAYMPYIYLYQLGRSKYGYYEYLITKSVNRDDLLKFAFWRTNICRCFEANAQRISKELTGLI